MFELVLFVNLNLTVQTRNYMQLNLYWHRDCFIQNAEQSQDAENSALSEDQRRPAPWTGREGQVGFIFSLIFLSTFILF